MTPSSDFFCYSCAKHCPLEKMKLKKDSAGRTRRICQPCVVRCNRSRRH